MLKCIHRQTFACHTLTQPSEFDKKILEDAVWIDLVFPTEMEETFLENHLKFDLPNHAEMIEIELSSRLYARDSSYFMTILAVEKTDSRDPILEPVTFVLTPQQLITVRYVPLQSFDWFSTHLYKECNEYNDPVALFMELLELMIDRLADTLEFISRRLESYSKFIFKSLKQSTPDYMALMQDIGANGDLNSKVSESLMTFSRLAAFFTKSDMIQLDKDKLLRLSSVSSDLSSLSEHVGFFSDKISFLLEATLGLVNIDQNHIIKIVSVAAVIFMPPTVVMSFYGMNFPYMPMLTWKYGYLSAIGLSVLSSWIPYIFFKHRKWL